ncbi:MAG TPA: hypothetical protein GXX14_03150 [Clostridiaceae bacterium]|nr:hypothetical protein [Clostridiaceae bacterium]
MARLKQKHVEILGCLDELKQYPDKIALFREIACQYTEENSRTFKPIRLLLDPFAKIKEIGLKNLGYVFLEKIYHGLGTHAFSNVTKTYSILALI